MQHIDACKHPHHHRYEECEEAEQHPAAEVAAQVVHVDFQPGEEHEVEKSHLAEDGKRAVAGEYVESERSHNHTCHNHPYDVWNFEPVENHRREQNDGQHNQENRDRIGDQGCCGGKNHAGVG